ncbi:uncharacterized protein [Nicotiana tomentosiformis]|uniref:uncharacterized protein n=1 Tax=Nicotiana tomentosiformis TaxID=4098 RepID=UPI00388C3978
MFDEIGDLKVHLRMYCDKLVGVGRDERIRMKLFMRSLTGDALSWYISQNPKKWVNWKKPTETFREYATRWRYEAAKVRPALEEEHMNKFFVRAQDPQYYERLMNFKAHRNALMKVLNEAYVPNNITSGEMANMIGQVLESHKITFHEDELPPEGLGHNRHCISQWSLRISSLLES